LSIAAVNLDRALPGTVMAQDAFGVQAPANMKFCEFDAAGHDIALERIMTEDPYSDAIGLVTT
jgi:hypothetical protein